MEDSEGVLSFDFEGGLDTVPSAAAAPSGPLVQHDSSAAASAVSNGGPPAPVPSTADPAAVNVPGRRSFRQTVCRHWLRSLCMKGDACGFLHQYDKARMPVCRFFRLYGECREQDCVYKHTNEDIKECNMYKLGFCPNGPDCRYRHAKSPGPPPPVEEVLQKIQHLYSYNYNSSNKFFQQRGSSYAQQAEKSQLPQGTNSTNQVVTGKPLPAESGNAQPQQQVQQSQQQVSQSQMQNVANGQPNQASRSATPLPQGISRYFIVKSCNRENLELSVQQGVWATQRSNESKLNEAFDSVENVILIFSVNRTRHFQRFIQTMRAIQGALIVASSIQIILGYSQVWGLFSRFFSPLGMAPVVGLVGLGLFQRGFPVLGDCVEIGIPMLLLVIGLSQYLKHVRPFRDVPIFERFPVLICVPIVWIYAVILTASGAYRHKPDTTQNSCRTDRANLISTAPWFMFPYPFQWGPPTFSAGHSFAMMSAVIVSMVESTGAYMAASRLAIATPPPAYVLSRGIGWQGIGVLLDGVYGSVTGSTVSVENVGLLGLTRVGSRRVVQISSGFMIFFSILGKFGAVFASIPFPIFAALYCILFGLVASIGISFLQFTNLNCMRNLIIIGLTLFLGISVPQFFDQYWTSSRHGLVHTNAGWFNAFLNTLFSSPPTVGLIVAVLLDNTLEVERSKKDRGMPWWVKFRTFKGDNRNEEFYTLPFNLNRLFPPT